jgi:basic membrane protein A
MKTRSVVPVVMLGVLIALLLLSSCQPQAVPVAQTVVVEVQQTVPVAQTVVVEVEKKAPGAGYKIAAIFPGVITDADYNTLGYVGLTTLKTNLGMDIAYSESVPVPDVETVMRDYLDAGYNIIWTHGGQFIDQTVGLAKQFPDVVFIGEGDAPVENPPANFWFIDRNFHNGFYAIGALAAKATKTGKIGYIGGLTLPFSNAEVHAIQQAIADTGADVEFKAVWTGDFNDPAKARQVADTMIADGVDVIMGSLNLGMFGIFESVNAVPDKHILVTAKYSDKSTFAPNNYITSVIYDFSTPLNEIANKVIAGQKGGIFTFGFGQGVSFQFPLHNVSPELSAEIESLVQDVASGKIEVKKDISPIE